MSPRYPLVSAGNDSTSVGAFFPRNRRLSARTRASDAIATVTPPRARAGAIAASHAASRGARRAVDETTSTCSRSAILAAAGGVRVVRLYDLLHELVPYHVAIVEVDEPDAVDVPDDLQRLDE